MRRARRKLTLHPVQAVERFGAVLPTAVAISIVLGIIDIDTIVSVHNGERPMTTTDTNRAVKYMRESDGFSPGEIRFNFQRGSTDVAAAPSILERCCNARRLIHSHARIGRPSYRTLPPRSPSPV